MRCGPILPHTAHCSRLSPARVTNLLQFSFLWLLELLICVRLIDWILFIVSPKKSFCGYDLCSKLQSLSSYLRRQEPFHQRGLAVYGSTRKQLPCYQSDRGNIA
ncbi:hypothetical protein LIER_18718 [Lithospermum erythrorhizon]|uniref:Uncharacterized protein n=1 Tax=Lithospermum erythrorhizon TaxID=34254 RepID=A0AAV3QJ53_LITER